MGISLHFSVLADNLDFYSPSYSQTTYPLMSNKHMYLVPYDTFYTSYLHIIVSYVSIRRFPYKQFEAIQFLNISKTGSLMDTIEIRRIYTLRLANNGNNRTQCYPCNFFRFIDLNILISGDVRSHCT